MEKIVEIKGVSKKFHNNIAVDNVSLELEVGKVYGIFGKNGAGKSTLIKMLLGLKEATDGELLIKNKPAKCGNRSISYLPEDICIYSHLSAYDNLKIIQLINKNKVNKNEIIRILEEVNLHNATNKKVKNFSLGMKRRLQLAMALYLNDSDILILDEPTNGLDVVGMSWFKDKIKELKEANKTILIASHSMNDMEELITDYIILEKGKLIRKEVWNQDNYNSNKGAIIECDQEDTERIKKLLTTLKLEFSLINNKKIEISEEVVYKDLMKNLCDEGIFVNNLKIKHEKLEHILKEI